MILPYGDGFSSSPALYGGQKPLLSVCLQTLWGILEEAAWCGLNNRETAMDRNQKAEMVKVLEGIFDNSGSVVMAEYSGMTVAEMEDLRAKLREHGAAVRVVNNRLAKIALKGRPAEAAAAKFVGPVAIAYAEDMISAPKVTVEFAKDNKSFNVVGGFMGDEIFEEAGIVALSKLPSREELIGMAAARLLGQASEVTRRLMSQGEALSGAIAVIEERAAA